MSLNVPLDAVKFDENGLVPCIVQDRVTRDVLMLAYMNRESLAKTMETGRTWFWSRSRSELWPKGETSGNIQKVRDIRLDCDGDAVLMVVDQEGTGACHTGEWTCFHRGIDGEKAPSGVAGDGLAAGAGRAAEPGAEGVASTAEAGAGVTAHDDLGGRALGRVLDDVMGVILDRRANPVEGSYTCYLLDKGKDKILKKVGEETSEVIIASKNDSKDEVVYETADLLYHLLVLLAYHGYSLKDVARELDRRKPPSGPKK